MRRTGLFCDEVDAVTSTCVGWGKEKRSRKKGEWRDSWDLCTRKIALPVWRTTEPSMNHKSWCRVRLGDCVGCRAVSWKEEVITGEDADRVAMRRRLGGGLRGG